MIVWRRGHGCLGRQMKVQEKPPVDVKRTQEWFKTRRPISLLSPFPVWRSDDLEGWHRGRGPGWRDRNKIGLPGGPCKGSRASNRMFLEYGLVGTKDEMVLQPCLPPSL